MGSNADYQRIVRAAEADALEEPMMQVHVAMREMAERDYESAIRAFSVAEADPTLRGDAFSYKIYALSSLGRRAEALALVKTEMATFLKNQTEEDGERPPLSPFWSWMKAVRGIDPFVDDAS